LIYKSSAKAMNNQETPSQLIKLVVAWSASRSDIVGVALVGSHARNAARPDSDIDLMLLTDAAFSYRESTEWLTALNLSIANWRDADYGAVWSRHITTPLGSKIELGFGEVSWANTTPIDAGTLRVVSDGMKILRDAHGILENLADCVRAAGAVS
jgi:uncharacterized protein